MLNRRLLLAASVAVLASAPAFAQDWKSQYPELTFAVIPSENSGGVLDRYEPMISYLSDAIGVPVTLRIANDYAAVIEGLRGGQVQFAHLGPAAYARAYVVTEGNVEPFAAMMNSQGAFGYYSVLYVRADDAAQSIEDLEGRNLCLVDPNSASGNNVPRFALDRMGIDPDAYFGEIVYAGSHENAITALNQGSCDAAFNWWNTEVESNLLRMVEKGMVKAEDYRIIFKSDMIPSSPTSLSASLPDELKELIRDAFYNAHENAPEAFARLTDGQGTRYGPVSHDDYKVIMDLTTFVDQMRRRRPS
jgi:phosphonate transport system substrate-binding protein